MALPLSNTGEFGLANATTLTTGNSASPNAFDAFAGSAQARTDDFMHGAGSVGITQGTTVAATYVSWTSTSMGSALATLGGRFYLKIPGTRAASSVRLVRFLAGTTVQNAILLTTTGALQWGTGTGDTANGTASSSTVPVSTWVRVEFNITATGASVSAGANIIRWFTGDSTSQNGADATNAAAASFPTLDAVRIGNASSNGVASTTTYLDDIALQSSGFPGPAASAIYNSPIPRAAVYRSVR